MADKDVPRIVEAVAGAASLRGATVVATQLDVPRAMPAGELARPVAGRAPALAAVVEPDPARALERALAVGAGPVVVAGSLYLVGAARARLVDDPALRRTRREPAPADPDRPADVRLGRADVRDGHPQHHARLVLGRRAAPGGARRSESALDAGRQMVAAGADLLDVGGESTPTGQHRAEHRRGARSGRPRPRAASARRFPDVPLSIDTIKPEVAEAALDAGADLLNDVWGVARRPGDAPARGRAGRAHRPDAQPRRAGLSGRRAEVVDDLRRALDRARAAGVRDDQIIVDPGIGFGKTADHNLELLSRLEALRSLGRPILLGTSRKSTLGRLLDLPPDQRVEATLATTALGIAAGSTSSACTTWRRTCAPRGPPMPSCAAGGRRVDRRCAAGPRRAAARREASTLTDRIVLHDMRFQGHHGQTVRGAASASSRSRWMWSCRATSSRRASTDDLDDGRSTIRASTTCARRSWSRRTVSTSSRPSPRRSRTRSWPTFDADEVTVRVRKPAVRLSGPLGYAGVEIHRRRSAR